MESRAYVRKKFFPDAFLSRVDMGLSYATTQDDVTYGIVGKSFELTDDGLTTLDVKGGVSMGAEPAAPDVDARVELTQKIFNFQEDQDLKLPSGWTCRRAKCTGRSARTTGRSTRTSRRSGTCGTTCDEKDDDQTMWGDETKACRVERAKNVMKNVEKKRASFPACRASGKDESTK